MNNENPNKKPMPDRFMMDVDSLEWLTDKEAKAYEKWLDTEPTVSSTEGSAPVFDLDTVVKKPKKKQS